MQARLQGIDGGGIDQVGLGEQDLVGKADLALGFLVAENGVYAAALGTPDGLPALIEVGLIFDLVVVISVAALFSARIHEQLGTADTGLLKEIRD